MTVSAQSRPTVMVSSAVYGIEELLDRIHTLLTGFGYEVWMSHKGTLPVRSDRTAFENCLAAVEQCDLFLSIITPRYGSGKDNKSISITHQELQRAIEKRKPRWLLAHQNVVFARRFLIDLGYKSPAERENLPLKKSATSIDDLRVIDMYEEAILNTLPLPERHGNWVQEFRTDQDALLYASAQFGRFQEVEAFLQENFANRDALLAALPQADVPDGTQGDAQADAQADTQDSAQDRAQDGAQNGSPEGESP